MMDKNKIAMIYVIAIEGGKKTIKDVPAKYKDIVNLLLEERKKRQE